MSADKKLERERKNQQVINAFHRVFETPDGKLILEHLRAHAAMHIGSFRPLPGGRYDPLHAALCDGQKSMVLHIEEILTKTVVGDANIEKPQTTVTMEVGKS